MNKIVLCNIKLINWYGFTNTTIPVAGNLTLISGENECGKSTILDAIKYAYTGDTQFNRSTSGYNTGVGKRNLVSYTRCLIDPSAGIYARPADKVPVVYTHIALEYFDETDNRPFVLGVVIETAVADIRGTYWYALDGRRIADLDYVYQDGDVVKPYDASGFQKKHQVQLKKKQEGITLFMQMVGLRLSHPEVTKYQTKLRNLMAYNPAAKIQEFIRESVLEKHDVNFDKLKEARKNIEQINGSLERIELELADLDKIIHGFDEYDKKEKALKVDSVKLHYKSLLETRKSRQQVETRISQNLLQQEHLEKRLLELEEEIKDADDQLEEAKHALREMDVSKAIRASKEQCQTYERQKKQLQKEKDELEIFQRKVEKLLDMLAELGSRPEKQAVLRDLTAVTIDAAEKQTCLDRLREQISDARDQLLGKRENIADRLRKVQKECQEQNQIIEECRRNQADFSQVTEQKELIREINREFKKQGIDAQARMACEYVAELKDEAWRDAIEAFLNVHRYAIIVPPEYFDIANGVMDASRHRYVELVNTKRLRSRELKCAEDAVYHYLDIQNDAAARYFTFWLGGIHAVELSEVPKYDNAMSKEGKLSRNMAVTYINTKKIKSYCLGSEAIELNRYRAEKLLRQLELQEKELLEQKQALNSQIDFLKEGQDAFRSYHLDAHKEYQRVADLLEEESRRYQELMEAQKNNEEFMQLTRRVEQLEKMLTAKKKEQNSSERRHAELDGTIASDRHLADSLKNAEAAEEQALENARIAGRSNVEIAVAEYDAFLTGRLETGDVLSKADHEELEEKAAELKTSVLAAQQAYNNRKAAEDRLPEGLDQEAEYQGRRGRIWISDLQGTQSKLQEQTRNYERIFKREFVLKLYEAAKAAKQDIAEINKELRKLQFSTKYQFEVKLLDDKSDYAKVLRYAEYLQETNNLADGQFSLTGLMGYDDDEVEKREKEIRDLINRMIDSDDKTEIESFADYRNYMSYEIIINNDEVKDGKLSRQVGYNSGAGTQIPYTIILSAALSMLYNARPKSVRLLFIDEPFEKMSDHNIKLMLDFFRDQNFQVIFCAPPNKLESIGSECGVIIPVLKNGNDDMQIGKVKFHDEA